MVSKCYPSAAFYSQNAGVHALKLRRGINPNITTVLLTAGVTGTGWSAAGWRFPSVAFCQGKPESVVRLDLRGFGFPMHAMNLLPKTLRAAATLWRDSLELPPKCSGEKRGSASLPRLVPDARYLKASFPVTASPLPSRWN